MVAVAKKTLLRSVLVCIMCLCLLISLQAQVCALSVRYVTRGVDELYASSVVSQFGFGSIDTEKMNALLDTAVTEGRVTPLSVLPIGTVLQDQGVDVSYVFVVDEPSGSPCLYFENNGDFDDLEKPFKKHMNPTSMHAFYVQVHNGRIILNIGKAFADFLYETQQEDILQDLIKRVFSGTLVFGNTPAEELALIRLLSAIQYATAFRWHNILYARYEQYRSMCDDYFPVKIPAGYDVDGLLKTVWMRDRNGTIMTLARAMIHNNWKMYMLWDHSSHVVYAKDDKIVFLQRESSKDIAAGLLDCPAGHTSQVDEPTQTVEGPEETALREFAEEYLGIPERMSTDDVRPFREGYPDLVSAYENGEIIITRIGKSDGYANVKELIVTETGVILPVPMGQEGKEEWHAQGRVVKVPFELADLFSVSLSNEWRNKRFVNGEWLDIDAKKNFDNEEARTWDEWREAVVQGTFEVGASSMKLLGLVEVHDHTIQKKLLLKYGINSLAPYLREARRVQDTYALDVDLAYVIERLGEYCTTTHYEKILSDVSHGLKHALKVVDQALQFAQENNDERHRKADKNIIALGGLLHDVMAPMRRARHNESGAVFARLFLVHTGDYGMSTINSVCNVIYSHENILELPEGNRSIEAEYVYDADRVFAAEDIERIVSISMNDFKRKFFNARLSFEYRMDVLSTNDMYVVDAERNDCFQYLLRNVTKGISPDDYATVAAKKFIARKNLFMTNKQMIAEYAKHYLDDTTYAYAMHVLDDVVNAYRRQLKKQRGAPFTEIMSEEEFQHVLDAIDENNPNMSIATRIHKLSSGKKSLTTKQRMRLWDSFEMYQRADANRAYKKGDFVLYGEYDVVEKYLNVMRQRRHRNIRVLDVGCGKHGTTIADLKAQPQNYNDVDASGVNLNIGTPASQDITLTEGDILAGLSYEDNSFDLMYESFVFQHFLPDQWTVALREVMRILAVDGVFIVRIDDMMSRQDVEYMLEKNGIPYATYYEDPLGIAQYLVIEKRAFPGMGILKSA